MKIKVEADLKEGFHVKLTTCQTLFDNSFKVGDCQLVSRETDCQERRGRGRKRRLAGKTALGEAIGSAK